MTPSKNLCDCDVCWYLARCLRGHQPVAAGRTSQNHHLHPFDTLRPPHLASKSRPTSTFDGRAPRPDSSQLVGSDLTVSTQGEPAASPPLPRAATGVVCFALSFYPTRMPPHRRACVYFQHRSLFKHVTSVTVNSETHCISPQIN